MKSIGLNPVDVMECVGRNSYHFGKSDNARTHNRLLQEDRDWALRLGVILHPSISINNITYRGDVNGYDIFRAVCAGFKEQPRVCKGDNVFEYLQDFDQSFLFTSRRNLAKVYHVIAAILVVIAVNLCALYLYRRYTRRQMNDELANKVNSAVS